MCHQLSIFLRAKLAGQLRSDATDHEGLSATRVAIMCGILPSLQANALDATPLCRKKDLAVQTSTVGTCPSMLPS